MSADLEHGLDLVQHDRLDVKVTDKLMGTDLEHGSGIVSMGGCMPQVVGLQTLGHQVPRLGQQALPLHIHSMLLIPSRPSPAQ